MTKGGGKESNMNTPRGQKEDKLRPDNAKRTTGKHEGSTSRGEQEKRKRGQDRLAAAADEHLKTDKKKDNRRTRRGQLDDKKKDK